MLLTKANWNIPGLGLLLSEEVLVSQVGNDNKNWKHEEGDDGFPQVDVIWRHSNKNDEEPEVRKHGEEGSDTEHIKRVYPAYIWTWNAQHADSSDDKQVEGSRADDGAWAQIASSKSISYDLDAGKEDLWSAGSQCHQCQVGDSVVPNLYLNLLNASFSLCACYFDGASFACDLFNGTHECVRYDGHSEEAPDEANKVYSGTTSNRPCFLIHYRQQKSFI